MRNGIAISMDGKGAWRDNVFVERLWRSIKYEEVYLRAYGTVSEARASIGRYRPSTTAHQNTHLSMSLKKRGFAERDAIPRGILGSCRARSVTDWALRSPARNARRSTDHRARVAGLDLAGFRRQPERLGSDLQELRGVGEIEPGLDAICSGFEHWDAIDASAAM